MRRLDLKREKLFECVQCLPIMSPKALVGAFGGSTACISPRHTHLKKNKNRILVQFSQVQIVSTYKS